MCKFMYAACLSADHRSVLLAPNFAVNKCGGMGVSSLHNSVIGPMAAAYIGESVELAKIRSDIVHVRRAVQQTVHNGHDLGAGNRGTGTESSIAITHDPAMDSGVTDIFSRPIPGRYIGEVYMELLINPE